MSVTLSELTNHCLGTSHHLTCPLGWRSVQEDRNQFDILKAKHYYKCICNVWASLQIIKLKFLAHHLARLAYIFKKPSFKCHEHQVTNKCAGNTIKISRKHLSCCYLDQELSWILLRAHYAKLCPALTL